MSLWMSDEARSAMDAHVARAYPEEGCGVLAGEAGETLRVTWAAPARNAAPESRERRYALDPAELLAVMRAARERGLEVLGFYHSHPDHAPLPSRSDREEACPWYRYLIVAVYQGRPAERACWRLEDYGAEFAPEPLEFESPPEPAVP